MVHVCVEEFHFPEQLQYPVSKLASPMRSRVARASHADLPTGIHCLFPHVQELPEQLIGYNQAYPDAHEESTAGFLDAR